MTGSRDRKRSKRLMARSASGLCKTARRASCAPRSRGARGISKGRVSFAIRMTAGAARPRGTGVRALRCRGGGAVGLAFVPVRLPGDFFPSYHPFPPRAREMPGFFRKAPLFRKKLRVFHKKRLTGRETYAKIILTCEKGLSFYAYFRFSGGGRRPFGRREAVGVPSGGSRTGCQF